MNEKVHYHTSPHSRYDVGKTQSTVGKPMPRGLRTTAATSLSNPGPYTDSADKVSQPIIRKMETTRE